MRCIHLLRVKIGKQDMRNYISIPFPHKTENLLTSCKTITFSERTLFTGFNAVSQNFFSRRKYQYPTSAPVSFYYVTGGGGG